MTGDNSEASEHPSITRFRAVLAAAGGTGRIVVLPASVHTAALAAEALGCEVEDWRSDPPPVPPQSRARVAVNEAAWAVRNLLPWVWEHLSGHQPEAEATCKRPDLLPVH